MNAAIYPGSFDPIHNGHVDIIRSGLVAFDKVIVSLLRNPKKNPLFTMEERLEMIGEVFADEPRVEVDTFEGLLVDYCTQKKVDVVLRGLRAVSDFEYELQMANMNRHMRSNVVTVFVMASDDYYVSSSLVKEAARLGGDVYRLVPDAVAPRLRERVGR